MTLDEFNQLKTAPTTLQPALRALWHDHQGNWDEAHRIAQDIDDETGAWVHAYLHRKEGDLSNAAYWYRRARRNVASGPLSDEWTEIVQALLTTT
jgi:hypothetical protein